MCRLLELPLTLESTLGHGTLFAITLADVRWPTTPITAPAEPIRSNEHFINGHVIWVLDNDPNVLQAMRSEEHTSELQSRPHLVCRLLLEKKKKKTKKINKPPV